MIFNAGKELKVTYLSLVFLIFSFIFSFSKAAVIYSTETGGAWADPRSWEAHKVPSENDQVIIKEGAVITFFNNNKINSKVINNGKIRIKGHTSFNKEFINKGEIEKDEKVSFVFNDDLYNEGKILATFSLKANLFNSPMGKVNEFFLSKNLKTGINKIVNEGEINKVSLSEDVEFHSDQKIFNFFIDGRWKNIILSSDTEFTGGISNLNLKSKEDEKELNIKFTGKKSYPKHQGDPNMNLIISEVDHISFLRDHSKWKRIIFNNPEITNIVYYSNTYSWRPKSIIIDSEIINNGDIKFNYLYITKSIKNNGIISGRIFFKFKDNREFRYIISENKIITEEEKKELEKKSLVKNTENLTPYLSQVDKNYYIHIDNDNIINLKDDIFEPEISIDYSQNKYILPTETEIDFNFEEEYPKYESPVSDLSLPSISLKGDNPLTLKIGDSYEEPGAIAKDSFNNDISQNIVISSEVDINKVGEYLIKYEVKDNFGYQNSITRRVKVVNLDQEPPVITLKGGNLIILQVGEEYQEYGATAIDETDGDLSNQIEITNNINYNQTGIYKVIYKVSDNSGNLTFKERIVKITGGNASIGLPEEELKEEKKKEEKRVKTKLSGKDSLIRRKKGEVVYSCKNSKALNFSNMGIHKESLCVYSGEENKEAKSAKPILPQSKKDLTSSNPSIQKQLNQLREQLKELEARLRELKEGEKKKLEDENKLIEKEEKQEKERKDKVKENKIEEKKREQEVRHENSSDFRAEKAEEKSNLSKNKILNTEEKTWWDKTKTSLSNWKNTFCYKTGYCDWEEEKEKIDITKYESAKEGEAVGIRFRRDFGFKIAKNSKVNKEKSNNQETYILIHGFRATPKSWAEDMSSKILSIDSNAQILLLDWSDITNQAWIDIVPDNESTWIKIVSDKLSTKLKEWNINPNKTTIIGHSLGTLLGSELANKIERLTKKEIKNRIFLDPASGADYKIDLKNTSFFKSGGFKNKGKCFVAEASWSGSEKLLQSCKEKYIIDYNDLNNVLDQHSWTHATYRQIIISPFYNNHLSPQKRNNQFNKMKDRNLNGIIYTPEEEYTKIKYLKTITKTNPNLWTLYGNTQDNQIECDEEKACLVYGYMGDDEISLKESKSFIQMIDFGKRNEKDKIIIENGFSEKIKEGVLNNSYGTLLTLKYNPIIGFDYTRQIFLEGVSEDEVGEWIKILNLDPEKDSYYDKKERRWITGPQLEEKQKNNPIQIE